MNRMWLGALVAALVLLAASATAAAKGKVKRKGDAFVLPDGARVTLPAKQATCASYNCMESADRARFDACVAHQCKPVRSWQVGLERLEQEAGEYVVTARLHAVLDGYGWYDSVDTSKPLYVGLTVEDDSGATIDAPAITLEKPALDQKVTLRAPGGSAKGFLVVAWSEKIAPCDDERMGCKKYGYLLDMAVASYPPGAYDEFYGFEQPLASKEPYEVRIVSHKATKKALEAGRAAVVEQLRTILAPYGVEPRVVDGGKSATPCRQQVSVWYTAESEHGRAALLAQGLRQSQWLTSKGVWVGHEQVETSPTPLTVCIGAP